MSLLIAHRVAAFSSLDTSLLIVLVSKGNLPDSLQALDGATGGALARCWATGDFTGGRDETALLYPATGTAQRILLLGMGEGSSPSVEGVRRAAMIAGKRARTLGAPEAVLAVAAEVLSLASPASVAQSLAEGVPFGAWHYPDLKRPPDNPKPIFARCDIVTEAEVDGFAAGIARGNAIAAGQALTRRLQVTPGNTCTPEYLAAEAVALGERHAITVTVLDRTAIIAEGMHALMAVSQGSALEPRFIILEYRGSEAAPVVLVGKGVTFDTGGISIKPSASMEEMKYDMSGAAAVLGTFETLGRLRPAMHVIGLVPTCENMPSGTAYKPGDVVGSHFGKTIEVLNTDAEGRLILADALSWARRYTPAAVVDCATLTGAVVIGLGFSATGVLGTDAPLVEALRAAGERAGERVWELPLWDEYKEHIKSDIADVKNTGGRPAGTITAALFLKEFVEGYPWAHLDIAGTAYTDRELATQARGPTGVLVRLFTEFLLARG
ncbi:MAG: leucyl aminopeptidase [Gemmatimonadota bacterium]